MRQQINEQYKFERNYINFNRFQFNEYFIFFIYVFIYRINLNLIVVYYYSNTYIPHPKYCPYQY